MNKKEIALVGNPNSGKTSLFNELTGANQSVGNWPGVTVERKSGRYKKNPQLEIQDLPGIYSLAPYTPEELVARKYLTQASAAGIINVVDGTNLERNLYLSLQLLDLNLPLVIALNMSDLVEKQGKKINLEKLSYALGVPVVPTSGINGSGLDLLIKTSLSQLDKNDRSQEPISYDPRLEVALAEIASIIEGTGISAEKLSQKNLRWYSLKLFERDPEMRGEINLAPTAEKELQEIIRITEEIFGDDSESIVINQRYQFISRLIKLAVINETDFKLSVSDKIDHLVTNRWLALPIFASVMWFVYYLSIQTLGTLGTDWVNDVLFADWVPTWLGQGLAYFNIAPWLQSLVLDGIVAGVGSVLGFLPQMIVLFLCLAFLEDCGYMSRIAFVMDRLFRKFGLSGKSFIPMLIATGCGVPGIMASRTIENERDRRITIMVTTFIPCSAKLPIIALIAGAFFPSQSWVAPSAYFVGMLAIVLSGIILKKLSLFSGDVAPFIMELPSYHWPRVKGVCRQTYSRSRSFVKKAGTIIFVSSIIIWFLSNFNYRLEMVTADESLLANLGNLIAFMFIPLGWGDWRATVATITGLVAKENVVNTFGILYGGLNEVSENGAEVWSVLRSSYPPLAGYSFLLFNLLCAPCFAAIGAMYRELADLKWTLVAVAFQTGLAYSVSFIVYQLGRVLIMGLSINVATVLALGLVLGIIYLIMRQPQQKLIKVSLS